MLRNVVLSLSLLCLLAICALTINCGGSSNSNTTNGGGPYDVVGDWQINLSGSGGSTGGYGVINSSGEALFFDSVGETLELPTITGASSFSGTVTLFDPGDIITTASVQGTVNSATSISGTLSGNLSATASATSYSPVTSVTALTGAMTGQSLSGVFVDLTLTPTGTNSSMSFTGSFVSCDVTGTFTQEGGDVATLNVFDVQMTFSGTGCATPTTSTITGLGFESSSDYFTFNCSTSGTYLYADMLDPAGPFILEIYVPAVCGAADADKSTPTVKGKSFRSALE
jgi:hypothetical protein